MARAGYSCVALGYSKWPEMGNEPHGEQASKTCEATPFGRGDRKLMSLVDSLWIPVFRASGRRDWVTPLQIGDADIVSLDANRADFNGALAQFLIGLLQTTTPMDSQVEWETLLDSPPDEKTLGKWFEPVRAAFVLGGDGPRFMQDLTLKPEDGEAKPIAALLIEAPGEQALKFNTDHFVKRDTVVAVCSACAATMLLALQTNAPSGGAGHRTSLRGGGPLTTLVINTPRLTLWQDLWLNVRERSVFLAQGGDPGKTSPERSFPWTANITTLQKPDGEFSPIEAHPAHAYWAMPRRIRLDLNTVTPGICDICRRQSDQLIARYVTKNYGINYKGAWNHPLSPYYENKPGEWLPLHPQPGGYGYKHWLSWALGSSKQGKSQRPSSVVSHFLGTRHRNGQFRLWSFGYDMDKMKARCWYESTLPLYGLASHDLRGQSTVQAAVSQWIEGADLAAFFLRKAVRDAWFSPNAEARGDLSSVDAGFYAGTESSFYLLLRKLIESVRDADNESILSRFREQWLAELQKAARRLFDETLVGSSPIERQNPKRIAESFRQLDRNLLGPKLRQALGLPVDKPAKNAVTKKKSKKGKAENATGEG